MAHRGGFAKLPANTKAVGISWKGKEMVLGSRASVKIEWCVSFGQ